MGVALEVARVGVFVEVLERVGDNALLFFGGFLFSCSLAGAFLGFLFLFFASLCFFFCGALFLFGLFRVSWWGWDIGLAEEALAVVEEVERLSTGEAEALREVFHGMVGADQGSGVVPCAEMCEGGVDVSEQWQ